MLPRDDALVQLRATLWRAALEAPKSRAGRPSYNKGFTVPAMPTEFRHDLSEMDLTELEQALDAMGHPRFHARQLFQWVHKRGVVDFGEMTDLGRDLRSER